MGVKAVLSQVKHALLPLRMRWALRGCPDPIIVEVGANDGSTGDPVHALIVARPQCRALLIEPVPYLFERLRATYAGFQRCTLENIAIAPNEGTLTIYYVDPSAKEVLPDLPSYYEELASFSAGALTAMLGVEGSAYLREISVQARPLGHVLATSGFEHVDLLQVDTEGFDYEVLKTFPFGTIRPKLVCFEHNHLSESDRAAAVALVRRHGYRVERWGKDFVCTA